MRIGPFSLQPSEFAMVMMVLTLALYLSMRRHIVGAMWPIFSTKYAKKRNLRNKPLLNKKEAAYCLLALVACVLAIYPIQNSMLAAMTAIAGVVLFMLNKLVAPYMNKVVLNRIIGLVLCVIIIAIPTVLVFLGGNMATVIIMLVVGGAIIFIASKHWVFYILPVAGAGIAIWRIVYEIAVVQERSGMHFARIRAWLNPFEYYGTQGYQTIQSLYAVASGGWFGLGLGQSNQKQLILPEAYNDFIFAIIIEETGLVGAFIVLFLFGVIVWRGLVVARNASDMYGSLIAAGAVVLIAMQVLVNAAVALNIIPNTGSPMPFISYGGTSVVFSLALVGILLNVSRYAKGKEATIIKRGELSDASN